MDPHWTESFDDLLNTKDLEESRESPFSFKLEKKAHALTSPRLRLKPRQLHTSMPTSLDPSALKSVAHAMRALQTRIRELESSQSSLTLKCESQKEEKVKVEATWRTRLSEELQLSQERSRQFQEELAALRNSLKVKENELEQQVAKTGFLEGEVKRLTEARGSYQVLSTSDEKMHRQIELLNAQLASKKDEFERVKLSLQQALHEKQVLYEELQESLGLVQDLERKLDQIKGQAEVRGKDFESVRSIEQASPQEMRYSRKEAELTQQLKRQEREKEHYERLISSLSGQQHKAKTAEEVKQALRRQGLDSLKSSAFLPDSTSVRSPQPSRRRSELHIKRPEVKRKSPQYSVVMDSALSPHSAKLLEQEIDELNRQYKDLLEEASREDADLEALRVELNSIAAVMEAKSHNLYNIRRRDLGV
jgi:chromosome segregation ATPase